MLAKPLATATGIRRGQQGLDLLAAGARAAGLAPATVLAFLLLVLPGCGIPPRVFPVSPPPTQDIVGLVTPEAEAEGRALLAALQRESSRNGNSLRLRLQVADHREGVRRVAVGDARFLLSCRWVPAGSAADLGQDPETGTKSAWQDCRYFYLMAPLFHDIDGVTTDEARDLVEAELPRLGGYCLVEPTVEPNEAWRSPASLEVREVGRPLEAPASPMKVLAVNGKYPTTSETRDGSYPLGLRLELTVPSEERRSKHEVPAREAAIEDRFIEALERRRIEREKAADPLVCVRVGGDVMLSRRVARVAGETAWEKMMGDSAGLLRSADIAIVNLESPLGTKGRPLPGKMIWFRAPPEAAAALTAAGVDAAVVANNHILDYDTENLLETLDILKNNGIVAVGGGKDIEAARRPAIIEAGGIKIGLLAYSEFASPDLYWSRSYPRSFLATDDVPGVAPIRVEDIRQDIRKAAGEADVVMVAFHWGAEDTNVPLPFKIDQKMLAREVLAAGASAVLGFHPHALQGIQAPEPGKWVLYSLGNLVMDQKREIQKESMVATLWVNRGGIVALNLAPLYIQDCSPLLPGSALARRIGGKMRDLSLNLCETAEARAKLLGQAHPAEPPRAQR